MSETPPSVEIFTTFEFQRSIRTLAKKYRRVRLDLQPLFEQLQAGEWVGDKLGSVGYDVFKTRVKNSDVQKGKSGGYRVIYWLVSFTGVVLLDIYSKSEQEDIEATRIKEIILKYQKQDHSGSVSELE